MNHNLPTTCGGHLKTNKADRLQILASRIAAISTLLLGAKNNSYEIHSLKRTAKAPENLPFAPKGNNRIPSIHFQVLY